MKYTSVLEKDHEALRKLMQRVKSSRLSVSQRETALKFFIDLLDSHTIAEEKSLYEIRKDNKWLRPDILEGLQEHRVAEDLIKKIRRTTSRDLREAKIKVLCDYVEHHLDEEEEQLFPNFEKTISAHQSAKLITMYLDIREKTQKFKSKIVVGAI